MKIGIVLSQPPGYSETFFKNKIRGLIENGHKVTLFVDYYDPGFTGCVQEVLPAPGSVKSFVGAIVVLLTNPVRFMNFFLTENRSGRSWGASARNFVTSLHVLRAPSQDWLHFGFATMAVGRESVAQATGARMAVSLRGYDISRYPLRNPGALQIIWKKVDRVHAISKALLVKAQCDGLPAKKETRIIHPAINSSLFRQKPFEGKFPDKVQLLMVARMHWTKGIDYVMEALSILDKSGVDFQFTIIGDGSDMERYVFAAHQVGVAGKIHFAGKAAHEMLREYYAKAHIYIQYSVQEGFCNAVLEAQSMALPCIVSDAEGLPENVLDTVTGWVVPRRQPQLLAAKILEVISMEPSKRMAVCTAASDRVRDQFDLEGQKNSFTEFFN